MKERSVRENPLLRCFILHYKIHSIFRSVVQMSRIFQIRIDLREVFRRSTISFFSIFSHPFRCSCCLLFKGQALILFFMYNPVSRIIVHIQFINAFYVFQVFLIFSHQFIHSSHIRIRVVKEALQKLEPEFQIFKGSLIGAEENRRPVHNYSTIYSELIEGVLRSGLVWLVDVLLLEVI